MVAVSSQKRHVILVGTFLVFLLTVSYYQYASRTTVITHTSLVQDQPLSQKQQQQPLPSPAVSFTDLDQIEKKELPCDKGNIPWLASDRQYWDGWKTKSFFLQPDGNFTLDNVFIEQENGLCIVVLLGPIPAASKIRVESHYAPPDMITMTAIGQHYSIPITLEQYPKQSNAYYANVYFKHSDKYVLSSVTEYRSYFWETPILHNYQPFQFDSSNMAIVTPTTTVTSNGGSSTVKDLRACDPSQPLQGSFRNDSNIHQFIPDQCEMKYTRQDGLHCLRRKTIHVWGDGNIRRNLKSLSNPYWCDMNTDPEAVCVCNDDLEDLEGDVYPWVSDHTIPLALGDNQVHYNSIGSITLQDWRPHMTQRVQQQLPAADMVILNVGNDDIPLSRMKPHQFYKSLSDLVHHMQALYPDHTRIILRTPQYFGTGQHYYTSWNYGRSRAFANVVRDLVSQSPGRLRLWDTHQFGLEYTTCRYQGTTYTKRNIIDVENQLLLHLFCSS